MREYFGKMNTVSSKSEVLSKSKKWESADIFQFHDNFSVNTNNGLYFNNIYLPEEVVTLILSYIDPKQILKATIVCKKWCNIIKSDRFWATIYLRHYNKKPKKLPWYVYYCLFSTNYFDQNLLKNGNGENEYKFWKILLNGGDGFLIEDTPAGTDPLPLDVPDFNEKTTCFATSYSKCSKFQEISLANNRLIQYILNKFKPHIYLSEWVAARYDAGCIYTLWCRMLGEPLSEIPKLKAPEYQFGEIEIEIHGALGEFYFNNELHVLKTGTSVEQWAVSTWSKIELVAKDYPPGVKSIIFHHQGRDIQGWAGHYGSKMAGGVVKILFDSIECNV